MPDTNRPDLRGEERRAQWGFASILDRDHAAEHRNRQLAMLLNVSPHGMCLQTNVPMEAGEVVVVHVNGARGSRELVTEVRWVKQTDDCTWDVGLEIQHVPPACDPVSAAATLRKTRNRKLLSVVAARSTAPADDEPSAG